MKVAVVVLNWNGEKLLKQFLPTLIKYSKQADIYVIDNCSTDDSVMLLQESFSEVKIISNTINWGFSKGYNEGLKSISADILTLVNSDIEVTENWLDPIISKFESQPQTAIIQPKILDYKQKTHFEYAGAAGGYIDKYGYPYCRGRIFDTVEKDVGQYDDNTLIHWVSGACFFIRKTVFDALQGFDEDFFAHQEEIDLCWRARNKGYQIGYSAQSVVYHIGGATLDKSNPNKTFLNFRNSLYMLVKNLPQKYLFRIVFIRMVLDGIAGIRFLSQGKIRFVIAILKAHFYFYKNGFKMYKKRNGDKSDGYFEHSSIIKSYYLDKKTTFNSLKK